MNSSTTSKTKAAKTVDGVGTTKLSGDLNPKSAVDAIIKLSETPACSSELQERRPAAARRTEGRIGRTHRRDQEGPHQVYIGEDDHIVRKVAAELTIEPKGTGEKADVEFELTLGKVNEKVSIKAPAGAEPIEKLFGQLGVNPLELLGMLQGGGSAEGLGGLLEGVTRRKLRGAAKAPPAATRPRNSKNSPKKSKSPRSKTRRNSPNASRSEERL